VFECHQRSEKAFGLALMQTYVEGASTRKASGIFEVLRGHQAGKSQVSALSQKLDAEINRWSTWLLAKLYPHLIFDARYEKEGATE
jgi:transposase-like protein